MQRDFFKINKPKCLLEQHVKRRKRQKIKKIKIFLYLILFPCFFLPAIGVIYYLGFQNPSDSVKKLIVQTNMKKKLPKPRMDIRTLGNLEKFPPVKLLVNLKDNSYLLTKMPTFDEGLCKSESSLKAISRAGNIVFFTLNPELQNYTRNILQQAQVPHAALVAIEPKTGKVIAIEGISNIKNFELYAGMPAASLFKIVTATAALEAGVLNADSRIAYRGSDYTLNKYNFSPNDRLDTRYMSLSEALGKSCNPVFGRVALKYLNQATLMNYTNKFGFNEELPFDMLPPQSEANIPESDYELSRTGAGFGDVHISPLHAAMMMSGIANSGIIPRPYMIEKVVAQNGEIVYQNKPQVLQEVMNKDTAAELLRMMVKTTTMGTSRKYFRNFVVPVSAKTGTLQGTDPKGLTNWFIASAPSNDPKVAIAIVTVHNGKYMKTSSQLGRMFLEKYFEVMEE